MIGVHCYQRGRLRLLTVAPSTAAGFRLAKRLLSASPAVSKRLLGGELVVIGPPVTAFFRRGRAGK